MKRRLHRMRHRLGRRGQSLTEFTLVMVMLIGVATALVFFLSIFSEQGWRILQLIALENP